MFLWGKIGRFLNHFGRLWINLFLKFSFFQLYIDSYGSVCYKKSVHHKTIGAMFIFNVYENLQLLYTITSFFAIIDFHICENRCIVLRRSTYIYATDWNLRQEQVIFRHSFVNSPKTKIKIKLINNRITSIKKSYI